MKKIAILLVLCSGLFATKMAAQPSFYFFPEGNIEANDGDLICIPVQTADFTDLLKVQFSVNWDPAVLEFVSIQNLNAGMMNLTMSDIDISPTLTDNGMLTFSWEAVDNFDCNNSGGVEGETVADDMTMFEICFNVTGIYGGYSEIKISDNPLEQCVHREKCRMPRYWNHYSFYVYFCCSWIYPSYL